MEKDKGNTGSPDSKSGSGKIVVRDQSDNEDSEVDDYNLTEDQKRALEELDNLKTEMGYPGKNFDDFKMIYSSMTLDNLRTEISYSGKNLDYLKTEMGYPSKNFDDFKIILLE